MIKRWICEKLDLIDPASFTITITTVEGLEWYRSTLILAMLSSILRRGKPFPIYVETPDNGRVTIYYE